VAKKAKKQPARKRKTAGGGKLFRGDLPKIRRSINAVAKRIEAGRKKAIEQIAKAERAPAGSRASATLAGNKAALRKADELLAGLKKARMTVADLCCHNDQGCNFLVMSASHISR
jgi:hypothetical protein